VSVSDTDGIFRDSSLYIVLDGTENSSTQKKTSNVSDSGERNKPKQP
jgi:hypothetical protein